MPETVAQLVVTWQMSSLCLQILEALHQPQWEGRHRHRFSVTVNELGVLVGAHPSRIRHEVVRLRRAQLIDVAEFRRNVRTGRLAHTYAITDFGSAAIAEARAS